MNYNNFIQRSKSDIVEGNQGNILYGQAGIKYYEKITKKEKRKQEVEESILEYYNNHSTEWAERNQEDWEYEEIFAVYMNMKEVYGTKFSKQTSYRAANELQRTIGAINWCSFHLFSERKDLHRSNTMVEFRKEFGLDKGDKDVIA